MRVNGKTIFHPNYSCLHIYKLDAVYGLNISFSHTPGHSLRMGWSLAKKLALPRRGQKRGMKRIERREKFSSLKLKEEKMKIVRKIPTYTKINKRAPYFTSQTTAQTVR